MQKLKHILVIRLSAMGDVAMTVPVLRAFTQQHPNVKITVLTREFFSPLFSDLPNVNVYSANVNDEHKGVLGLYKLSKELKKIQIDAVADLHNVLRSKIVRCFLYGIKSAYIDKGRTEKKALISGKDHKQLKTTHQRYADVFKELGFSLDLSEPTFPEKKTLNSKILDIVGSHTNKWTGIAPFAAHESKMYPLDLMEQVIASLSKTHKVLLFGGGKREIQILNKLETDNVINLAGKLSFSEELDLISNLDLMVSMDSGNAHLAAMFGKKVITIWGVTHPFAGFTPFNQPKEYALLSDRDVFPLIPTSIYGNKYTENYKEAARSILPESIVKKIESIL